MYETFEHTADLGLRIRAADLDTLFAEAALALASVLVEDPATVRPLEAITVQLEGTEPDLLLFDWLRELLYRFDAGHRLFSRFAVTVRPDGLTATAWGEPLNRDRHRLEHEVKAITYHGLHVAPVEGGWQAEVIVDI